MVLPALSIRVTGLRMDRQTLDMEGARQGEVSAASLQLADDTIAIRRIATMSIERHEFAPWDTPRNRKTQGVYATLCVSLLFIGLLALGWWALRPGQEDAVFGLFPGIGMLLIGVLLGVRAAMIAVMLKRREPYYRLLIGTSDGRQIPLVDNNRDVLVQIRDVVRHKLDTGDTAVTGDFDLNLDRVNLRLPKDVTLGAAVVAADPPAAPARARDVDDDVFDGPSLKF